jgi:2',3'-cyclic-nucleotide 2'-phosphodiesterase
MTRLLFIGDIVGKPGRELVRRGLGAIVAHHQIDLVIANVENAAAGFGITPDLADDLFDYGVQVMTGGNHTWDKKEILPYFADQPRLIRPANLPQGAPGRGRYVGRTSSGVAVAVINVMGRVFMTAIDDPFRVVLDELAAVASEARIVFVDFHAEATSEKIAFARLLDGKVSAVVGTHTHVQTADEQIFPGGTAYLSDAGFTGPQESVLGREIEPVIKRFISGMPQRFEVARNRIMLHGAVIEVDEATGRALQIERVAEAMV